MILVFDLDDTITETDLDSEKYINEFIKEHNLPYKQIATKTRFAEGKFDWSKEEALKWYKEYGDQMMLEFSAKEGAVECINRLYDEGHTIIIATARATDWHTKPREVTLKWIDRVGLKYNQIYIGRIDKENICLEVNADVFIDDDLKTVNRVKKDKAAKCVFLADTPYNHDFELDSDVFRLTDFELFERKIRELSNKPKR